MKTSVEGQRVLVTAGAAGIGRAIAQTFLEHGARVHICDVDAQALAAANREMPAATQTRADVASTADVDRLFEDVARELGGLDVLVFTAGIGENSAEVRAAACERLAFLGIRLDETGKSTVKPDADISDHGSQVRVLVIRAKEDWAIARGCLHLA